MPQVYVIMCVFMAFPLHPIDWDIQIIKNPLPRARATLVTEWPEIPVSLCRDALLVLPITTIDSCVVFKESAIAQIVTAFLVNTQHTRSRRFSKLCHVNFTS